MIDEDERRRFGKSGARRAGLIGHGILRFLRADGFGILTGAIAFKGFSEFFLAIHAVDSTNGLSIKLAIATVRPVDGLFTTDWCV